MPRSKSSADQGKISREFAERLRSMAKTEVVRIVVMVETPRLPQMDTTGKRRDRRAKRAERKRAATDEALGKLDTVLAKHGGRTLSSTSALGTIAVETRVSGIEEIAALDCVRSIMEDQQISLIK